MDEENKTERYHLQSPTVNQLSAMVRTHFDLMPQPKPHPVPCAFLDKVRRGHGPGSTDNGGKWEGRGRKEISRSELREIVCVRLVRGWGE